MMIRNYLMKKLFEKSNHLYNQKKISLIIILTLSLSLSAYSQTYDLLAVQRINDLIANNGLQATPNEPETWNFATWNENNPKQLIKLNFSIKYLSGVASFAGLNSLQQLFCYDKNLIELDVSNCSELQELKCYGNKILKLDVTNCFNLKKLDCRENNLSNLDISTCSSLEELMINKNSINALELTNMTDLKTIQCTYNKMSILDIANCSNLIHLDCGYNNLSVLNITNCPSLIELLLNSNYITELNLTNFPNLKVLTLNGNNLTDIDLSNCKSLFWVLCNQNKLSSIDLTGLNDLLIFNAYNQNVHLNLLKNNENEYICDITLNNPVFGNSAISYWENILTSTSNSALSTTFTVQTGKAGFELSGRMNFTYSDVNILENIISNSLKAYISNEKLYICGLKVGEKFSVYTISGVLVYKGVAAHEEESVDLQGAKGIYVVRSGERAVKVIKN